MRSTSSRSWSRSAPASARSVASITPKRRSRNSRASSSRSFSTRAVSAPTCSSSFAARSRPTRRLNCRISPSRTRRSSNRHAAPCGSSAGCCMPILKLFFNPNPLIQALNIQSRLNATAAEREAKRDAARYAFDQLHYEVMHNLVIETTRLGIEVKNQKMRLESLASRLEFNERRARALESVVAYKPTSDERPPQEGRREESRREESRREERRDEPRRDEPRRDESRRQDTRRSEPPARPLPTSNAPVAEVVPVPEDTPAAATAATQPAGIAEGPGQKEPAAPPPPRTSWQRSGSRHHGRAGPGWSRPVRRPRPGRWRGLGNRLPRPN